MIIYPGTYETRNGKTAIVERRGALRLGGKVDGQHETWMLDGAWSTNGARHGLDLVRRIEEPEVAAK